jgi:hypothetical protein
MSWLLGVASVEFGVRRFNGFPCDLGNRQNARSFLGWTP